jgi:type IV pilus assembly protein PilY1
MAAAGLLLIAGGAQAAAIISNGTVMMGVRDLGDLNVGGGPGGAPSFTNIVGLRSVATNSDSTSPGCTCEGWGAGIKDFGAPGNNVSGYANSSVGTANVSLVSFTSTASTAVSTVNVLGPTGAPILRVTHNYHPIAGTPFLYEVDVSIQNVSGVDLTPGQLVYRRVMDWDIPTPGFEHVDMQGVPALLGVANGNNVRRTDNNGFNSGNPFSFSSFGCQDVNFTDLRGGDACPGSASSGTSSSNDEGALFDFEFEALADGATRSFATFYGVAPTKADADLARALVDGDPSDVEIGLYSYGYPDPTATGGGDPETGAPNTFIFGFGAAGGVLVPPDEPNPTPEPASLALLGLGLAGLGWSRRRKAG